MFGGLILFAENEDQFAIALGHEMSHALLLHGVIHDLLVTFLFQNVCPHKQKPFALVCRGKFIYIANYLLDDLLQGVYGKKMKG